MANSASAGIDRNYYDKDYYAKHLERLAKKDRFTRVRVKRVFSLLRPKQGERIIDLGTGVGTMMVLLASSGATIVGMDYSYDSLQLAKKNFRQKEPKRLFLGVCCDGRDIAVTNSSVDGVMAIDFTEHLDDSLFVPTVLEVFRILKPGGRFIVYTPSKTHIFELLKKHNIILKEDKSHIGLRTMKEYIDILSTAGFTVKDSYFEPTHIPVFNIFERTIMPIPGMGDLFKRRICICAVK
jgi:ubiquinone/menaquinone biosynthesis C-methylase UbiE